jgi:hypothetical protein
MILPRVLGQLGSGQTGRDPALRVSTGISQMSVDLVVRDLARAS